MLLKNGQPHKVKRRVDANGNPFISTRHGENDITVTYDSVTKRPIRAEGVIRKDYGARTRGDNATDIGHLAGKGEGYDGGHVGAHRFYGDTPDAGIVPQNSNLNRGAYSKMENEWADWSKKGYEVKWQVDLHPPGSKVPKEFRVKFDAVNPNTNKSQRFYKDRLFNKAGENFVRVYAKDMPSVNDS